MIRWSVSIACVWGSEFGLSGEFPALTKSVMVWATVSTETGWKLFSSCEGIREVACERTARLDGGLVPFGDACLFLMYRIGRSLRDQDACFWGDAVGILPLCLATLARMGDPIGDSVWRGVWWGGRLLKGNGGVQRFAQNGWKSFAGVKVWGILTARLELRQGRKSGLVIRWFRMEAIAQRIKATLGISRLSPEEFRSTVMFGTSMWLVASWCWVSPNGWAFRPLKRHASWVQNVVRQFSPYPSLA